MAYYNASDYKLKYRWSGKDAQERDIVLDIYQKSATAFTLTYIGGLASLTLQAQGGTGSVAAPIVKTSLDIVLVDAPDEVQAGYKYGGWSEFYTPDSTKYLVMLYRDSQLEWRGYITPDSWQESLDYRGSVTITARDNLGHLQDFDFDAAGDGNGLVSISSLLTAAMNKINFAMDVNTPTTGDAKALRDTDGVALLASFIYAPRFAGRNWYDVLETVLESIGYCLRFVGGAFVCQPVRNLPLGAATSRATAHAAALAIEFYGGDRSNDPAWREIRERMDYAAEDTVEYDIHKNLSFDSSDATTYSGKIYNPATETWTTFTGRSYPNAATGGASGGGWLSGLGFLKDTTAVRENLLAMEGAEAMRLGVNLAADMDADYGSTSVRPTYRIPNVMSTDVTVTCSFLRPVKLYSLRPDAAMLLDAYVRRAYVYLTYTDPSTSTKYYWNGSNWQAAAFLLNVPMAEAMAESYAFTIATKDISDMATLGGTLDIEFANFRNEGADASSIYGTFERLTEISLRINAKAVLKTDTITTVNNASYNVKVDRKPVVGALSAQMAFASAANYPAALWKYKNGYLTPYGYANYWNGYASSTAIPLPAQIHKQLLCFNHVSLQSLSGYCGAANKADLVGFGHEFTYKGQYFILQSGTLDVLTNRMRSVQLHEYLWYDDLWDETHNPSYSGVPSFDIRSNSGNVNGGASSSSGGGGGGTGTVTSVGLTVPQGLLVTGSPVTGEGVLAITLDTDYIIPLAADVFKGVTAYGWGNHAEAGYLTGITSAMITAALGFTPTANTGTVTSIKVTTPTGLRVSNGTSQTITGSGTFALQLQSGYSIPTTDKQSSWDAGVTTANAAYAAAVTNRVDEASGIVDGSYNLVTANAIYDKFNGSAAFMPVASRTSNYAKIADNATGDTYLITAGAVAKYVAANRTLNDLTDVQVNGPENNDFFVYSSSLSKWTNISNSNVLQSLMGSNAIGGQQSGSGMYRPIYWGGSSFLAIPAGSVASGNNYPVSGNEVYTHFLNTAANMSVDTELTSSTSKVPTSNAVLQYVGKITDSSLSTWNNNQGCITGAAMYGFIQESALMPVSKYADTTALPTAAANDGYFNIPSESGSGNAGDNHLATCSLIYKYLHKHWWNVKDATIGAAAACSLETASSAASSYGSDSVIMTQKAVNYKMRNFVTGTVSTSASEIKNGSRVIVMADDLYGALQEWGLIP